MVVQERPAVSLRRRNLQADNSISFIVNSVRHNVDSGSKPVPSEKKFESSSDAIANDIAIIKVLYGDEEKTDQVTHSNEHEQSKAIDVNNKKNGDGEGFIVLPNRASTTAVPKFLSCRPRNS
ncbi:hypothetical protein GH714_033794 [Hevea brasiliensis]|uniref:Uncharacterized protein n=1 Tax=Hevea brasiliensis TaxID=3981 RepID=A0A6A6NDZ6_HEVBR|nr:hypothetical protein GH714_033794 [Hevea brasiliensis]